LLFIPESLKRQNELIRTLQKQLEATERELADQKWILDQYLQSPSWKLTAPLRWIARQLRALKQILTGSAADQRPAPIVQVLRAEPGDETVAVDNDQASAELKLLYSSLFRVSLHAFINSNATLDLPTSSEPEVSIILVLFNRAELTLACLRSIRENYNLKFEIIIVDNASSDETSRLLDRIRGARIIRNTENRNFLLAVNQGTRDALGKYILLLNNDAQLAPEALTAALRTIKSDQSIGAVGGRIVLLDGSLQEAGSIIWRDGSCLGYGRGDNPFASTYMFRRDVDYCSGAFLLTPRETWVRLGGFDEAFFPAYYEETDYCLRLWEHGLRVVYEPDVVILHYEFASSQSASDATALQNSHRQIFVKRHAPSLKSHWSAEPEAVLEARTHGSAQHILFVDDRVPHPWLGSGFPRARTMLLALRKQGFDVTLFPTAVVEEDWATVYSDLPREIEVMNELGPSLLEAFLRHRKDYFNAIVISRPHNMNLLHPIVAAHPDWFEKTSIIYDAEALFAPRDVGLRQLSGEQLSDVEVEKVYEDEVSLAATADCVIAVSEMDRTTFRSRGIERVYLLGHALDTQPTANSFEQRSGFLFVGAIHDEMSPNGDSMIWFLTEIWPSIVAQLGSDVSLTIAGINRSDSIRALAGPNVQILGHLEDVSELYNRARVFVAPTRFAAGIPHKVHEAAARGIPVVATPVLARQLGWNDGVEIAVAEHAATFADKCLTLHRDRENWSLLRETALAAIRRECSRSVFDRQLHDILAAEKLAAAGTRYADAGMDR